MLKPSYIFLWIIVHLTAVELPEKIRKRGEPHIPVTELVKENRYPEALTHYKSLSKVKQPSEYRSLANAFHQLGYYDTASKLMNRLFMQFPKKVVPEDQLLYAELLRKKGFVSVSDSIIQDVKTNTEYAGRLVYQEYANADFLNIAERAECLRVNPVHYRSKFNHDVYLPIRDVNSNTWYYHEKQPINSGLLNNISTVDGKPYGRIKYIDNLQDTLISNGVLLPQQVWNRHLELSSIDKRGNMFVTMNIPTVNDQDKFVLNIRRMFYDSSVSKIVFSDIGFEKFTYNTSGLALSPSETNAVFTSDMYGGMGKADLWYGSLNYAENGSVKIENFYNLGELVNTEKSEFDACFITDNILAFISDGHVGYGGKDLFFFHLISNKLINAGEYINSRFDELAPRYFDGKLYYSSNRLSNRIDIFSCDLDPMALEKLLNPPPKTESIENSESQGDTYVKELVKVDGKSFTDLRSSLRDDDPRKYMFTRGVDFLLAPDSLRAEIIEDIDSSADYRDFKFMTLFHPYDHIVIEADYERELILLSKLLKKRPDWGVIIRSHTDSKGKKSVNKKLSQERADFLSDYLKYLGVEPSQIMAEGVGEALPLNHCYNDAPCTEEEYARNRRTELILMRRTIPKN